MSLQPHLLNTVACGLAVFLLGIALHGKNRWQCTTLAAPCLWVAISALCLIVLSVWQVFRATENQTIGVAAMRFAAAASTLCPAIAVLGAKRPQDRGWQWVVFTLWLIVVWPAAQAALNPPGPRLEIFPAWQLFLWALVAMGPLNYLATRNWFASLLVATGQLLVLGEFLEILEARAWPLPVAVGCFLFAAAAVALRSPDPALQDRPFAQQTRRWLDFRDGFGAFWGLRIMQRVNETAALRAWPVELTWAGFEYVKPVAGLSEAGKSRSQTSATVADEIDQSLDTLLRRFL